MLLALGLPSMSQYIQNQQDQQRRSEYYAGLPAGAHGGHTQQHPVEFVLTNGTGVAAHRRGWSELGGPRRPTPARCACAVDQKIGAEGEGAATQAIAINVTVAPGGFDGRITFNGFGAPTANPYSIDITNPVLGACAPGGPARCRRINVNSGGQITACDPAASTALGDSRAC